MFFFVPLYPDITLASSLAELREDGYVKRHSQITPNE